MIIRISWLSFERTTLYFRAKLCDMDCSYMVNSLKSRGKPRIRCPPNMESATNK